MKVRTFSVVGEALNFGGRRMETIARVAWLAVVLSLVLNMASVFAILSVANDRLITFTDLIDNNISYGDAFRMSAKSVYAASTELIGAAISFFEPDASGPAKIVVSAAAYKIAGIYLGTLLLSGVLISAFMAPMIRLSGLGERPQQGFLHLPFGGDQIRYLAAGFVSLLVYGLLAYIPVLAAAFWANAHIASALQTVYVSFPDPESLHTIQLVKALEVWDARGEVWIYSHLVPLLAAVPFVLLFWIALVRHFHPGARETSGGVPRLNLRMIVTVAIALAAVTATLQFGFGRNAVSKAELWAFAGLGGLALVAAYQQFMLRPIGPSNVLLRSMTVLFWMVATLGAVWYYELGRNGVAISDPKSFRLLLIACSFCFSYYVMLRLAPYQGVAVCRRSLAPAGTFLISAGWNLLRLLAGVFLIYQIIGLVSFAVNAVAVGYGGAAINTIYQATLSATKLVNSGEAGEWVYPFFVWLWTAFIIVINLLMTFFFYGVIAGLQGRLFRDSEMLSAATESAGDHG